MLSVCVIGSEARRTKDSLSDRDVLLIGESSTALKFEHEKWEEQGWNVAVFSQMAFSRLAKVRSLFVQHVKLEGQLIRDDQSYLQSIFQTYTPKPDYVGERNDALRSIGHLPQPTGGYWHDLCLGDIVSVFFRNAAILHLASAKHYLFAFDDIVTAIATEFALNCDEQGALLKLREMKYCYRARIEGNPSIAALPMALRTVGRIASSLGDLLKSSIEAGITSDDYLRQRLRELDLVRNSNPLVLDRLPEGHTLKAQWQAIKGAGGYPRPKLH